MFVFAGKGPPYALSFWALSGNKFHIGSILRCLGFDGKELRTKGCLPKGMRFRMLSE